MVSYGALAILAFLVGANAATESCSKQIESEMKCMLSVTLSPDAKTLKERVKQVMKTCAPNIPAECHAQKEAAMECATTIFKNADTDADLQATKKISGPAVDQCFEQHPPDVKKAFFELFMSHHGAKPHRFNKKWHKRQHNDTSSSGESSGEVSSSASGEDGSSSNETSSSFERKHGGGGGHHRGGGGRGGGGRGHHGGGGHGRGGRGRGGRGRGHKCRPGHKGGHHGPRNLTDTSASSSESSESSNKTGSSSSSSSGSSSKGKGSSSKGKGSGSSSKEKSSGERHGVPSQCRKTKEQMKCVRQEMKKLGNDSALVDTINTLMGQKKKCKQLVSWSCSIKSPKKKWCVFKATKPCRQAFIGKLKTCLQEKGFTLPPFMTHGDHTQLFTTPLPTL